VVPLEESTRIVEFLGDLCGLELPDSLALRVARQNPEVLVAQRRRAFEDWLVAACGVRPVLWVIEDLHWVDRATIEVVTAALRRARDAALLVLALSRPEVQARFPRLADDWCGQEIRLDPLRAGDCAEVIRVALGPEVPTGFVDRLATQSGGNPFFLEELIRTAAVGQMDRLPDTVLGSIQLRLARFDDRARQALRSASIFGARFTSAGVTRLLGWRIEDTEQQLAILADGETIIAAAGAYAFRHDLVRDAVYATLTEGDRRTGHRLAAEWLLENGEDDPAVLGEHFAGSGAEGQALESFERAAVQALADHGARQAAGHFRRAAELCRAAHENDNAIAFYERAAAQWSVCDHAESRRDRLASAVLKDDRGAHDVAMAELRALEREAEAAADFRLQIEASLALSEATKRSTVAGNLHSARQHARRAQDLARRHGLRELEAQAIALRASTYVLESDPEAQDENIRLVREALSITTEERQSATYLWRLGNAFLGRLQIDRAESAYREGMARAGACGDDLVAALCRACLGMTAFRRWRLAEAIAEQRIGMIAYERLGVRVRMIEAKLNLGVFELKSGEDDAHGERLLEEVIAEASDDWLLVATALEAMAALERYRGRESVAQEQLARCVAMAEMAGAVSLRAAFAGFRAESLCASGEVGEAVALAVGPAPTLSYPLVLAVLGRFDEAAEVLPGLLDADPDPDRRALARLVMARARWRQGREEEAGEYCREAAEILAPTPLPRYVAPVEAMRACVDGDVGAALAALREAQEHCGPAAADEVAWDVGELVAERGGEGDMLAYLELGKRVVHGTIGPRVRELGARIRMRLGAAAEWTATEERRGRRGQRKL
jgi:tetratricopeptide (TPR) repeat protein